jgi:hypothetical protein
MASHDIVWTSGAHVRFKSLDFIVTAEGELARALVPQAPPPTSLDAVAGALEELRLGALEAHTSERDQLLDFDFGRLEHQLAIYLGPHQSWEDLRALTRLHPRRLDGVPLRLVQHRVDRRAPCGTAF